MEMILMDFPTLRIGKKESNALVQGGMATQSSLGIPGHFAREGGIGTIAITVKDEEELRAIIAEERSIAGKNGILLINIMAADTIMEERLKIAIQTGQIDGVVQGAGYTPWAPQICKELNIPYFPIVSSMRATNIYLKKFDNIAGIVYEGKEAGGHLGDVDASTFGNVLDDIIKAKNDFCAEKRIENPNFPDIPIIVAGGITPPKVADLFNRGASGIQIATPTLLTEECRLSSAVKEFYINEGKNGTIIIDSPAGLPGRALKSNLTEKLAEGEAFPPESFGLTCTNCIKKCTCRDSRYKESFCIRGALLAVEEGSEHAELGLFFSGEEIRYWDKIIPIKDLIPKYLNI